MIEQCIRRRNPAFRFDAQLNAYALLQFVVLQGLCLLRGLRWLAHGRKPRWAMHGRAVRIQNAPRIRFGRFLRLGDQVRLSALGREGIDLGDRVSIGAYSQVVVSTTMHNLGKGIKLGNAVGIGEFAYLGGAGGLEIGDECIIGQYFSCHPENHNYEDSQRAIRWQGVTRRGIRIGRDCWIGSKVTILDGVTLGEGCVVAAGAVVTRSFPKYAVIGGVPAKLIKQRHESQQTHTGHGLRRESVPGL